MATWPTRTPYEALSGAQAKTLGQDMFDRGEITRGKPVNFPVVAVTTASGAEVSLLTPNTFAIRVPQHAKTGDLLRITIYGKCSGGGTAWFYWRETAGPTAGTQVSTASATGARLTSDITIPSDSWAGTVRTFEFRGWRTTAGTATYFTDDSQNAALIGNVQVIAP